MTVEVEVGEMAMSFVPLLFPSNVKEPLARGRSSFAVRVGLGVGLCFVPVVPSSNFKPKFQLQTIIAPFVV